LRALIPVVTAFTLAHSITLIASAYNLAPDFLWFPPLIETLIAASIVYMALENIVGAGSVERRWMIAFGFGLVHGFGFSFALRQFQWAWPVLDAALLATVLRWLMFFVILGGILWLFQMASRWWTERTRPAATESMDGTSGPLLSPMEPATPMDPGRPN